MPIHPRMNSHRLLSTPLSPLCLVYDPHDLRDHCYALVDPMPPLSSRPPCRLDLPGLSFGPHRLSRRCHAAQLGPHPLHLCCHHHARRRRRRRQQQQRFSQALALGHVCGEGHARACDTRACRPACAHAREFAFMCGTCVKHHAHMAVLASASLAYSPVTRERCRVRTHSCSFLLLMPLPPLTHCRPPPPLSPSSQSFCLLSLFLSLTLFALSYVPPVSLARGLSSAHPHRTRACTANST